MHEIYLTDLNINSNICSHNDDIESFYCIIDLIVLK